MLKIENGRIEELEAEKSSFQENNVIQQKKILRLEEALNLKEEETEKLSNIFKKKKNKF